jgi:hypothetical protein
MSANPQEPQMLRPTWRCAEYRHRGDRGGGRLRGHRVLDLAQDRQLLRDTLQCEAHCIEAHGGDAPFCSFQSACRA